MFASSGKFPGSGLTPTRRAFPAALPAVSGLPRFSFPLQLRGSAGLTPASFPRRSNFRGYIFENAALLLNILLFHRAGAGPPARPFFTKSPRAEQLRAAP